MVVMSSSEQYLYLCSSSSVCMRIPERDAVNTLENVLRSRETEGCRTSGRPITAEPFRRYCATRDLATIAEYWFLPRERCDPSSAQD
jgi:hypothetical protein